MGWLLAQSTTIPTTDESTIGMVVSLAGAILIPMRFSIRHLAVATLTIAISVLIVKAYLVSRQDYIPLYDKDSRSVTAEEYRALTEKGAEHYINLLKCKPAKTLSYWQVQLSKLRPGMRQHAISKYTPPQNTALAMLGCDGNQTLVFAVDSVFACAVRITTKNEQDPKIVSTLGVFEHELNLTGNGMLDFEKLPKLVRLLETIRCE
jgi:hypothetical protein